MHDSVAVRHPVLFPRFSCQWVKGNMLCVMIRNIHHPGMGFFAVTRAPVKIHQIDFYQRQKSWSFHWLIDILYMACYRLFLCLLWAEAKQTRHALDRGRHFDKGPKPIRDSKRSRQTKHSEVGLQPNKLSTPLTNEATPTKAQSQSDIKHT